VPATAGLLLTGGGSRRLGAPKAELRLNGERLADRGARVLTAVCPTALEVGPGTSSLPVVSEDPPGAGPLAAVVAGSSSLAERGARGPVVVLAVDAPFVGVHLLRWLVEHPAPGAVVPRVAGRAQPLCARYAPADLAIAADLLAGGATAMRDLLAAATVTYADEDAWGVVASERTFLDVDTPDAVTRAGLAWPARAPG